MSQLNEETKRKRSKDTTLLEVSKRGHRIIRLPFCQEQYSTIVNDPVIYRTYLDDFLENFPELFPASMKEKYTLHDIRFSKRRKLFYRRVESAGINYTIQPSFVTPYWTANCDDVWYPLLLLNYGVPYWLITMGYGHQDDFWYRLFRHLGRFNIVGTTARKLGQVPEHLVADEKISWWHGQKIYICTTSSEQCLWGAQPSLSEDTPGLTTAYGVFMDKAKSIQPDYATKSVNTDGWKATRKAWQQICKNVALVLCFLHGYLKVRQSAKKLPCKKELFTRIWEAYESENKEDFILKINELSNWANQNVKHQPTLNNVQKLHKRVLDYAVSYDISKAYRTSNMVDRPMRRMDRFLFINQYFHGHFASAQLLSRAFALCYNFIPFCPRSKFDHPERKNSRAAQYNQFEYHDNWLVNLLTSASLNGFNVNPQLS